MLTKYLWRKLINAYMAALTASLERANITSSTDQSISAGDLARDTTLTKTTTMKQWGPSTHLCLMILLFHVISWSIMRQWILTLLHLLGSLLQQATNRRLQMFQATFRNYETVEIHRVTLLPKNVSCLEDLVFPSRTLAGE